jgi:hypothetical protein
MDAVRNQIETDKLKWLCLKEKLHPPAAVCAAPTMHWVQTHMSKTKTLVNFAVRIMWTLRLACIGVAKS